MANGAVPEPLLPLICKQKLTVRLAVRLTVLLLLGMAELLPILLLAITSPAKHARLMLAAVAVLTACYCF